MRKRTVRRRWALVNPIQAAIGRAARLPRAELEAQSIPLKSAIDRLVTGRWEPFDWQAIRDAANRVEILLRLNRIDEPAFLLEVGLVVDAAIERLQVNGTKALRPAETEVLWWLYESYVNVLGETTRGQFADACAIVDREVEKILATRRNRNEREMQC